MEDETGSLQVLPAERNGEFLLNGRTFLLSSGFLSSKAVEGNLSVFAGQSSKAKIKEMCTWNGLSLKGP